MFQFQSQHQFNCISESTVFWISSSIVLFNSGSITINYTYHLAKCECYTWQKLMRKKMTKPDKKQKLIGTEYRYYGTTLQKNVISI